MNSLRLGAGKVLLALALVGTPIWYVSARYTIGIERTLGSDCLPWGVYLIDNWDSQFERGDLLAFKTNKLEPFYRDGTIVVKMAAGVKGDQVSIGADDVIVAGQRWGGLVHAMKGGRLQEMGRATSHYAREEVIEKGSIYMMGTHPRSYDSRYWGPIATTEVIGRAIPIW